jgi:hypothetical protein
MKNKNAKTVCRSVGRPVSKVVWPNGRFTLEQAYQYNGCYKSPPRVCKLTVNNHLDNDLYLTDKETGRPDKSRRNPRSTLLRLKNEFGETKSEIGMGRKPYIYLRRAQRNAGRKAVANLQKAKASNVTITVAESPVEKIPMIASVPVVATAETLAV